MKRLKMQKPLQIDSPWWIVRVLRWLLYYIVAVPILAIVCYFVLGLRIRGREHVKQLKGAVVVCNHVHYLDCVIMGMSMLPRRLIFTSLPSNFDIPFVGHLIHALGAVPVAYKSDELRELMAALKGKLGQGRMVAFYPEGHLIYRCPRLRKFKKGAFYLAEMANVPVVPIVIRTCPMQGWRRIYKRWRLEACVGEPLMQKKDTQIRDMMKTAYEKMEEMLSA